MTVCVHCHAFLRYYKYAINMNSIHQFCEMPIYLHLQFNPYISQQTELFRILLQLKLTWFNNIVGTNEIFGSRVAVASPWWLSRMLPSFPLAQARIGSHGTLNFCEHCEQNTCCCSGNKENKYGFVPTNCILRIL